MPNQILRYRTYKGIDQVPIELWDSIANKSSILYSSEYWRLIENSRINGFENFNYIVIFNDNKPVCVAACYFFKVDLGEYTPGFISKTITLLRKLHPDFLLLNLLECGAPINICSPPFIISEESNNASIIRQLKIALHEVAGNHRAAFIGIKDINQEFLNDDSIRKELTNNNYSIISSVPNSYINVEWGTIGEYLQKMRSYYRSKLNKQIKKNISKGISSTLTCEFSEQSEELSRQWLNVHLNTKCQKREILNSHFYDLISRRFPNKSRVILFYYDNILAGHALLLLDGEVLRWLYVGKKVAENDSLYIYIMYKVIETGITLGASKVDCGPTTYDVKMDLGAEIQPLYYAIRLNFPIACSFASFFFNKIANQNIQKSRVVFKR